MIITFTPNPAIDMTYEIANLRVGEAHAVSTVRERAGGKGVNTAGVLTTMGGDCVALCPIGRDDQLVFAADLDERGVRHSLVPVPGRVRRSAAAVEPDGRATVFNEPGGPWPAAAVVDRLRGLATEASIVAVCGSVPPGSEGAVLEAHRAVQAAGARTVLDLRGAVLRDALPDHPDLVKPNRVEAAITLGLDRQSAPPAAELAARLVDSGARAATVSDGSRGVTLVTSDGTRLRAYLSETLQGNATGAGDALTAALATHLGQHPVDWPSALRDGVAWSAAAVLQPVAGQVDPHDVDELRPQVVVEPVGQDHSARTAS